MANVINKSTLKYLTSVNTPDYDPGEWIINPVLPKCESKYWKYVSSSNTIKEMTELQKAAVDQAEADAAVQAAIDLKDINIQLPKVNKAAHLVDLDLINELRAANSLAVITPAQYKTLVMDKYDSL